MAEYNYATCGKSFSSERQLHGPEKTCRAAGCPESGWYTAAGRHAKEPLAKRAGVLEAFP